MGELVKSGSGAKIECLWEAVFHFHVPFPNTRCLSHL
jgi:hypothetical protein